MHVVVALLERARIGVVQVVELHVANHEHARYLVRGVSVGIACHTTEVEVGLRLRRVHAPVKRVYRKLFRGADRGDGGVCPTSWDKRPRPPCPPVPPVR